MASADMASFRLPKEAAPEAACWFWVEDTFAPGGYKEIIDLYENTSFGLLTAAFRAGRKELLTDEAVFRQVKDAATYAESKGIGLLLDLSVWDDLTGFFAEYPDELTYVVSIQTGQATDAGAAEFVIPKIAFEGCPSLAYEPGGRPDFKLPPAQLLRAYSYELAEGAIKAGTLSDVTSQCRPLVADDGSVAVRVPGAPKISGKTLAILGASPCHLAEIFAPHYTEYQDAIIKRYASAGLAGAGRDEGGDPAVGLTKLPWSRFRQEAYRKLTGGRDLASDFLLMRLGEEGREAERQAAINYYFELIRLQNAKIEEAFYNSTKQYFGKGAFVGTHPTWDANPNSGGEYQRNGLDWWMVKRDVAQTDEEIPYSVATAMNKKLGGPFWLNMHYSSKPEDYRRVWAYALSGGRMNFHPLFPPATSVSDYTALLNNVKLTRAEQRIRLLNLISRSPLDCPVAVVFGHAATMNYAGPYFEDSGTGVAGAFWDRGFPADLIPTSEIESGALRVDDDGYVCYGPQRYTAAVLYHPEFEKTATAEFWNKAAEGKTALFRLGFWMHDFDVKPVDSDKLLPKNMTFIVNGAQCVEKVVSLLSRQSVEPQEPGRLAGHCRLLDDTRIFIAAENEMSGDPLAREVQIRGNKIAFDAEGIVSVRLDKNGEVEAMAAGGLESFAAAGLSIELPQRADIALWRDEKRTWQGVLQGWNGPFPDELKQVTPNWRTLAATDLTAQPKSAVPPSPAKSMDDSQSAACAISRGFRLPADMPPVIGAWFVQEVELSRPDGYRDFLDAVAGHAHYNLLSTSMRDDARQMVDASVHDWFKSAAIYARQRGIGLVLETDPRHSIPEFTKRYPDELQERLWLQESGLAEMGEVTVDIKYDTIHWDAICKAEPNAMHVERVYSYVRDKDSIEPETVKDITFSCRINKAESRLLSVAIPCRQGDGERKACVVARITHDFPAVFGPHVMQFEADIVKQYSDVPLAGLMKDEWGFPALGDGNELKNGYWYSKYQADVYAGRTGGRDLVRDSLLMWAGEHGRERERQAAINHVMDMYRVRNTEIEQAFYKAAKETFGPDAFVGTHDTVFPYPDSREFERNGLNWWTATRSVAQSDEITPYCCRTSMAKKYGSPIWINQWYAPALDTYERLIWSYALAGGRMNFHMLYPVGGLPATEGGKALLRNKLIQGDCRIRLLNAIASVPVDCPVGVIFGHACAMNWAGPAYDDVGTELTDAFWRAGYYADLIPSSEIAGEALRVDGDGNIWFGKQRYSAVVLYHPEFENASTAQFFQKAGKGKTILYRIGDWTRDFEAKTFDGDAALPAHMKMAPDVNACSEAIIVELRRLGIEPETPATLTFPKWQNRGRTTVALPAAGSCRLIDGTVVLASGEKEVTGDPIKKSISVRGREAVFDAVGVAAVRFDHEGKTEAVAAGRLKSFKTADMAIELPRRADIALWRNADGRWQGILQGYDGDVPETLTRISTDWVRLNTPAPLETP